MTPEPKQDWEPNCWACQATLTLDIRVWIGEYEIPCCSNRWAKMSTADQLRIGQMFVDRAEGGATDAVRTVFRSALGNFIAERGGNQWMPSSPT